MPANLSQSAEGSSKSLISRLARARKISVEDFSADLAIHIVGVTLALIGAIRLVANTQGSPSFGVSVYSVGLVTTLSFSALCNVWGLTHPHCWLRRCDHAAIFIMIAASCTPFAMVTDDMWPAAGLVIVWLVALAGAAFKILRPGHQERLLVGAYVALGWFALAVISGSAFQLPKDAGLYLALGLLLYSTGVIFHVRGHMRCSNAIWHAFVLAGAMSHYFAVLDGVVLPPTA